MSSNKVDFCCPTSTAQSIKVKREGSRASLSPSEGSSLKHEWDNALVAARQRSRSPSTLNHNPTPLMTVSEASTKLGSKTTPSPLIEVGLAKQQYTVVEGKEEKTTSLNFFNLVFFTINVIFTFDLGFETINPGYPTRALVLEEYQTLVSPMIWTYLIWCPIFAFDGLFCVAQFISPFREISRHTVHCWYIISCILQVGWMISFSYEVMWLSCALAFLLMCILLRVRKNMYNWKKKSSFFEYWLCYFPFSFHGGFLIATAAVNLNIYFVQIGLGASTLFDMSVFTIGILTFVNLYVVIGLRKPDIIIALVIGYVFVGIYLALTDPSEIVAAIYDYDEIKKVKNTVAFSICVTTMVIVLRIFHIMIKACCFGSSDEPTAIPPARQESAYAITVINGNGDSLSDMTSSIVTGRTGFTSLSRGKKSKHSIPSTLDGRSLLRN